MGGCSGPVEGGMEFDVTVVIWCNIVSHPVAVKHRSRARPTVYRPRVCSTGPQYADGKGALVRNLVVLRLGGFFVFSSLAAICLMFCILLLGPRSPLGAQLGLCLFFLFIALSRWRREGRVDSLVLGPTCLKRRRHSEQGACIDFEAEALPPRRATAFRPRHGIKERAVGWRGLFGPCRS